MSPRNEIPDCGIRLTMECSGCRDKSSSPIHIPTTGEVASAVIPPTAAMAKQAAAHAAGGPMDTFQARCRDLLTCDGCPGSTEPNLKG